MARLPGGIIKGLTPEELASLIEQIERQTAETNRKAKEAEEKAKQENERLRQTLAKL